MKKTKRQQGFTLVETIVACALLMMIISMFGSITIFTLNLSFREKEAAQVEILADTLANRVDEILRDAQALGPDPDGNLVFASPKYPAYYQEIQDDMGNLTGYEKQYAVLKNSDADGTTAKAGTLFVLYAGNEVPIEPAAFLLLPNDSYESMTATLTVDWEESSTHLLRMNLTLNGTKYHTSYSRDFTVLMPNCETLALAS